MMKHGTKVIPSRDGSKPARSKMQRYIGIAAAVSIGAAVSVALFATVISWKWSKAQGEFQRISRDRVALIKRVVDDNLAVVQSLGPFFSRAVALREGNMRTLRDEFHTFASPMLMQHPDLQAFKWVPRVTRDARSDFERQARNIGLHEFQILEKSAQGEMVSAHQRDEYFPVLLAEPMEGNQIPVGFDVASNPRRLKALLRSRDTGHTVTTGRIVLVEETGTEFGILVCQPVYRPGDPTDTVEQRRQNLIGFALGILRVGPLVDDAISLMTPQGIDVRIIDVSADEDKQFLYAYSAETRRSYSRDKSASMLSPMRYQESFVVGGRTWEIVCTPTRGFLAAHKAWEPWVALLVGYLLTGTIVLYISGAMRHAALAQSLVKQVSAAHHDLGEEITQRKRAQRQLARANHDLGHINSSLEHRITERTADILDSNKHLRQAQADLVQTERMTVLSRLVAGAGHEINTPTIAILNVSANALEHMEQLMALQMQVCELPAETRDWLADTLVNIFATPAVSSHAADHACRDDIEKRLRDAEAPTPDRLAAAIVDCGLADEPLEPALVSRLSDQTVLSMLEHAAAMRTSISVSTSGAKKIARIVAAMQAYSRPDGEMVNTDINESLADAMVLSQHETKHIADVETDFAADLPPVECGPELSQVWSNILNNACDAIQESSPAVKGRISLRTLVRGDDVIVQIANDGPPIPSGNLTKIYEPFFTTKPVGKGTGLGLSICASILKRHKAAMVARNEAGRVVFEVTLPVSHPAADTDQADQSAHRKIRRI